MRNCCHLNHITSTMKAYCLTISTGPNFIRSCFIERVFSFLGAICFTQLRTGRSLCRHVQNRPIHAFYASPSIDLQVITAMAAAQQNCTVNSLFFDWYLLWALCWMAGNISICLYNFFLKHFALSPFVFTANNPTLSAKPQYISAKKRCHFVKPLNKIRLKSLVRYEDTYGYEIRVLS